MPVRDLFLLEPGLVFLNHGSFGACPAEVLAAQHAWQREMEANPVAFLGRRSGALLAAARERLAAFLGARAQDLAFVTNATTGVNVVARSLELAPGDEVVTTDHEYGACVETLARVCGEAGAALRQVEIPLPFDRDDAAACLLAAVTPRTRLVFLSHLTSATALVMPVAEVCRRARELGVPTLVDGAHAPGQLPLDLDAIGADFSTGNCHKWLCAPKGSAFLHARPEHHARLRPPVVSWGLRDEEGHEAYAGSTPLERRLQWLGTRDVSAFLAVPAALDFLERLGVDEVRQRGHALALAARARVGALTGLPPICADGDLAQMAAVALPPLDGPALQRRLLERHRVEVPVTRHAGRLFLRVACAAYTTEADLDALLAALACELAGAGRR